MIVRTKIRKNKFIIIFLKKSSLFKIVENMTRYYLNLYIKKIMNLKKISLYIFIFLLMSCSDPDLVTNKNKKIFLDDLKGQWIVINYWADWCPPCIKEIPELNALNEKHKDNLKVFLYNFDRLEGKELEEQLIKIKAEVPSIITDPQTIYNFSVPDALPVTFIIDKEGKLSSVLNGPQTLEGIEKILNL
tara:strand:+ start:437 stop:1003 length:567 start_codon:yes stop_codon:yes gene_type:complete